MQNANTRARSRRIVLGVIALLVTLFTSAAGAQPQPPPPPVEAGTASIAGRILDARTARPAGGVLVTIVTLVGGAPRSSTTTTDAAGVYTFDGIAEGSYMLTTYAVDYQMACYPNTSTDRCSRIELAPGDRRVNPDLSLTPNAVARGRIVDDSGAPIADATVRMTRERRPLPGGTFASVVSGRGVKTRADGTFELRGIAPGTWYLEASVPAAKGSMGLPVVFYPGVFHHDEATRIEFSAGGVVDDLVLIVPATRDNVLTVHIASGPVPIGDVRAAMIRATPFVATTITLGDDGSGVITGVLPGRYFIAARGWIKDRAWAAFQVADFLPPSVEVSLSMKPAGAITGKIVARNGGLPPLDGVVVAAGWTHDDVEINPLTPDQVPVEVDGSFKIDGLFGQRALRLIGLSPDWGVYEIRQGRSEISGAVDVPLDTTVDVTIVVARR